MGSSKTCHWPRGSWRTISIVLGLCLGLVGYVLDSITDNVIQKYERHASFLVVPCNKLVTSVWVIVIYHTTHVSLTTRHSLRDQTRQLVQDTSASRCPVYYYYYNYHYYYYYCDSGIVVVSRCPVYYYYYNSITTTTTTTMTVTSL